MATVADMLGTLLDNDLGMVARVCPDCGVLTFAVDESRLMKNCPRCSQEMQPVADHTKSQEGKS